MNRLRLLGLMRLSLTHAFREARAGEVRVLFMAIVIAVAVSCAIGYFGARLNGAMALRATEFLGADLVLEGSAPATAEQVEAGRARGLDHATAIEFGSVIATDDAIQLASVKAVNEAYPLRGQLRSRASSEGAELVGGVPGPGEAWAESRLLAALSIDIGATIDIGARTLRVSRILTDEPDRGRNLYSLNPHVVVNLDDLESTRIVQPGSRVRYRDLWRGAPDQLDAYRLSVDGTLRADQRVEGVREGNRQLGNALQRAERYLNLASLAAVLLAGVAAALSANRYAARRLDSGALLRCMGMSRRQLALFHGVQLLTIGLLASITGAALGWVIQLGLFGLLKGLLPPDLPFGGIAPAIAGMATGLTALAGFALPPLLTLSKVPPIRVLRRDTLPTPAGILAVYGTAFLALGIIMWRLSLDVRLTLGLLAGGAIAALVTGALLLIVLRTIRELLTKAPLHWRLGFGQLLRQPGMAIGQILAFGFIFFSMGLIGLLRGELLDDWQAQLPVDAPNHFALNIMPHERDAFEKEINAISSRAAPLYPMVAGRLIKVKGEPVEGLFEEDSRGERATRRDLNLTWSEALPQDNTITQGEWWQEDNGRGVSLEEGLAQGLGVVVGDVLTFDIGGAQYEVEVSSLRSVDWNNFQPNFFVIFRPGSLTDVPVTYLTSFYVPEQEERSIIELARHYPTVSILPVTALLAQLRGILEQVSLAIECVLLFVLAAGMSVLFAALQSTIDDRIRQDGLLRALGAERVLLRRARRSEFVVLGAASGALAALACELASYLLYRHVLELAWAPHPWLAVLPIVAAILITSAGLFGTRRAVRASPLQVLRGG
ncbi:ABC transporter permease [Pseudomonas sp. Marseille-QA0892]